MKSGDLTNFHDADASGGPALTGTDPSSPGSGILDSKNAASAPLSAIKTLVTGSEDPFGVTFLDQVLDAPTLPPGSGSEGKTSGSGNGWVPGGGGTGDDPLTAAGAPPDNGGNPPGGSGKGHKGQASGSTDGDWQGDWTPASYYLANTGNLPGSDVGGSEAVPEPGSLALFVTALLGIVVLKLRSTRTA